MSTPTSSDSTSTSTSAKSMWPPSSEKGYLDKRGQILSDAGVPDNEVGGNANVNFDDLPPVVREMIQKLLDKPATKKASSSSSSASATTTTKKGGK